MTKLKERLLVPFAQFIIRDIPSMILSLALFLGGIWLLAIRIPGWSLLFGLIFTPMGAAFMVFTLDGVARNRIAPPSFKSAECRVCGKKTYSKENVEDAICNRCRENIGEEILKEKG